MRTRKLLFLILLFSVLLNSCHERKNVEVITLTKGFHLDDLAITKLNR
jgi:outer membrane protein assembly factor BamE (lipoprotein component of BamABCDE complex)